MKCFTLRLLQCPAEAALFIYTFVIITLLETRTINYNVFKQLVCISGIRHTAECDVECCICDGNPYAVAAAYCACSVYRTRMSVHYPLIDQHSTKTSGFTLTQKCVSTLATLSFCVGLPMLQST